MLYNLYLIPLAWLRAKFNWLVDLVAVLSSPAAATPTTENDDKAGVFELGLTNLYERVLSATKGGRGAKTKVLVDLKVFETNKIPFGKEDNLVPSLKRVSNMRLKNVHPHMDMTYQFIQPEKREKRQNLTC